MEEYQHIIVKLEENVAVVTLNRPKASNALNLQMVQEIDAAFAELRNDLAVKAVIITGDKNFAAGADITSMVNLTSEEAKNFSFNNIYSEIENLPKPTIAAMSGFALGGGLELALACDIRIASPEARFGLPEINLGIFPGAGGTQRLPKLIGISHAKEMIFGGEIINADKALQLGLINQITDDPMAEAFKMAQKYARKASIALGLAKQSINISYNVDLNTGLEYETIAWSSTFDTEDQKEGMKAFLEKRKPLFKGK